MTTIKELSANVLLLMSQPARAWFLVARSATKGGMFNNFLYPMIALACLSTFLGGVFGNGLGAESFYPATVRMGVQFLTLFFAYHLSAFVVGWFSARYMPATADGGRAELLAGYSMVVILLLELCLGLFPNFRIIAWIAQFYTVKIVWDGAAVLLRVPEERRLAYTMVVSVVIIFVPIVIGRAISALSVNLG